jgi:hypothetical protein
VVYTAEEQARYREQHPEYVRRSRLQKRARNKALGELQRRHQAEYGSLYKRACEELDIK